MEGNLNEPLENPNNNIKENNKRQKTSWIWEFFDSEIRNGEHFAVCKLKIMDTDIPCKKEYKTSGSTKNCIEHLSNKHGLFPSGQNDIKDASKNSQVLIYYLKYNLFLKILLKNFYTDN